MLNHLDINTNDYWNKRFEENWEAYSGSNQSSFFSKITMNNLPTWLLDSFRVENVSFVDWGCAQGDGTVVWSEYIESDKITGVDFSKIAIQQAKERYSGFNFKTEDWLAEEFVINPEYDVVFSSNTLEHFDSPYTVLNKICHKAKKVIILALPYRELDRIDEHFFSFFPDNIPLILANNFRLIWSKVFDCGVFEKTYWCGEQIFLVYAQEEWFDSLSLCLDKVSISQDELIPSKDLKVLRIHHKELELGLGCLEVDIKDLNVKLAVCEENNKDLRSQLISFEENNKDLRSQLISFEENNKDLRSQLISFEENNKDLQSKLNEQNAQLDETRKGIDQLTHRLQLENQLRQGLKHNLKLMEDSRSWRMTKPLRSSKEVWQRMSWLLKRFYEVYRDYGLVAVLQKTQSVMSKHIPIKPQKSLINHGVEMDLELLNKEQEKIVAKEPINITPLLMLVESFNDGGVERVVIDLCLILNQKGYNCEIIVASSGGRSMNEARQYGISVTEFFNDKDAFEKHLKSYKGIILTHHCYFCFEVIHKYNIKLVEVLHNAYHWQLQQDYVYTLRQRYIDHYVAVSDFVKDYAANKLNIPINSITTINNGLNITGLIRCPLILMEKYREDYQTHPRFIHVANLHPQKNHLLIINAFAKILVDYPSARLMLAGSMDNYPDIFEALVACVKKLNIGDAIDFVGPLNRRDLSKLLANAHIALLPSQLEGFSIATLEYSFFGLPAILSDTGAAKELYDQYQHVLIAPAMAATVDMLNVSYMGAIAIKPSLDAIDSLSVAMLDMLASYPVWQQKALLAAESYQNYSIEHTAEEYSTLLSIIGGYND